MCIEIVLDYWIEIDDCIRLFNTKILAPFQNCLVHIMDHLSKVTAQCSRNKMNPQNLAICFAPVLMMDFSTTQPSATNISEPIQILKYLIEIWPKNQEPVL